MKMHLSVLQISTAVVLWLICMPSIAADSYRFFHVTIETPWLIFIFLLIIILFPFVLSAILYWHFSLRKDTSIKEKSGQSENQETTRDITASTAGNPGSVESARTSELPDGASQNK